MRPVRTPAGAHGPILLVDQGSSKRSEHSAHFEPNLRSERVRYFSKRATNVEAFKRL